MTTVEQLSTRSPIEMLNLGQETVRQRMSRIITEMSARTLLLNRDSEIERRDHEKKQLTIVGKVDDDQI